MKNIKTPNHTETKLNNSNCCGSELSCFDSLHG